MPLISILMAAYEAQDTILAAIASVRAQEHDNWEVIIASDCGSDYLALFQTRALEDGRVRMVATPAVGSGPSAARNAALAAANGDFIAILDSDDTWQPDKLSALLPLAKESGLACDNTRAVTQDGRIIGTAYSENASPHPIDTVTMMNTGVPHFPLLRRDLTGPGYRAELRFAEDVVFNMELIARAGTMTLLPRPLTNYVQRPDSASNGADAWQRAETAYAQILALLDDGGLSVPAGQKGIILAAIDEKRQFNTAYGRAVRAGQATTFQTFLAARRERL